MKTIKNLALLTGLFAVMFIAGCGSSEEATTETVSEVSITYTEEQAEVEKYVASLSVNGMACQMSCGNKISGTLAKLDGVKNTSVEFNGAEEENFVLVEYDADSISEKEMIAAVEGLANGLYSVKAVKVTHFIASNEDAESEKVGSYDQNLNYELPNIFSVFSRLF